MLSKVFLVLLMPKGVVQMNQVIFSFTNQETQRNNMSDVLSLFYSVTLPGVTSVCLFISTCLYWRLNTGWLLCVHSCQVASNVLEVQCLEIMPVTLVRSW